jgi:hypothetical protein
MSDDAQCRVIGFAVRPTEIAWVAPHIQTSGRPNFEYRPPRMRYYSAQPSNCETVAWEGVSPLRPLWYLVDEHLLQMAPGQWTGWPDAWGDDKP